MVKSCQPSETVPTKQTVEGKELLTACLPLTSIHDLFVMHISKVWGMAAALCLFDMDSLYVDQKTYMFILI